MCSTWVPAVLGEIVSRSAISLLERPCASSLSTSTSRGVRPAGPSRLAHRLVGVGRAEDARGPGDRVAGEPERIAGAVEPLAVLDGDRAERGERGRLVQHALGQVRLHAHPLPLAGAQRAALVEDRVGYAEPAEVVYEPGAAKLPGFDGGHAPQPPGGGGQLGDPPG